MPGTAGVGRQRWASTCPRNSLGNGSSRGVGTQPLLPLHNMRLHSSSHLLQETRFFNIVGNCSHPDSPTLRWGCDKTQVGGCAGWAAPSETVTAALSLAALACCPAALEDAMALKHAGRCTEAFIPCCRRRNSTCCTRWGGTRSCTADWREPLLTPPPTMQCAAAAFHHMGVVCTPLCGTHVASEQCAATLDSCFLSNPPCSGSLVWWPPASGASCPG